MKSWDERFVDEVKSRIIEDIQAAHEHFGGGLWINRDDAAATGMVAVLIQAQIKGLNDALKHIRQAHDAMTGKAEKKHKEAA